MSDINNTVIDGLYTSDDFQKLGMTKIYTEIATNTSNYLKEIEINEKSKYYEHVQYFSYAQFLKQTNELFSSVQNNEMVQVLFIPSKKTPTARTRNLITSNYYMAVLYVLWCLNEKKDLKNTYIYIGEKIEKDTILFLIYRHKKISVDKINLLLVDDASYSGAQLWTYLDMHDPNIIKLFKIVVPFITKVAINKLKTITSEDAIKYSVIMKNVDESIIKQTPIDSLCTDTTTLAFFQHKFPDTKSLCSYIVYGKHDDKILNNCKDFDPVALVDDACYKKLYSMENIEKAMKKISSGSQQKVFPIDFQTKRTSSAPSKQYSPTPHRSYTPSIGSKSIPLQRSYPPKQTPMMLTKPVTAITKTPIMAPSIAPIVSSIVTPSASSGVASSAIPTTISTTIPTTSFSITPDTVSVSLPAKSQEDQNFPPESTASKQTEGHIGGQYGGNIKHIYIVNKQNFMYLKSQTSF